MTEKVSFAVQRRLNKMRWETVTSWRGLRETKTTLKDFLKAEERVSCINPFEYRVMKKVTSIEILKEVKE